MTPLTDAQTAALDRAAESIRELPETRSNELQDTMKKRALSVEETAAVLGAHPETIRRMIRDGSIRAVRLGHGTKSPWRIPNAEIDRFLQEGPRSPASDTWTLAPMPRDGDLVEVRPGRWLEIEQLETLVRGDEEE